MIAAQNCFLGGFFIQARMLLFKKWLTNMHIEKCYRTALQTGAKVLALNVLETEYTGKTLIQRRNQLNSLIANHEDEWWSVNFLLSWVRVLSCL